MQSIRVMVAAPPGEAAVKLCDCVRRDPAFKLTAYVSGAEDAARTAAEARPQVIVLDLRLCGSEAGRAIGAMRSACGAAVLAMGLATANALPAFSAGAGGFILLPAEGVESEVRLFTSGVIERLKIMALDGMLPQPGLPAAGCKPVRLIAAAAAQGWPVQLACMLKALPSGCPPVLAVVSDPRMDAYSAAGLLCDMTGRTVLPGEDRMGLITGKPILIGGSRNVRLLEDNGRFILCLAAKERVKDAADELFRSAALAAGGDLAGVSLSGEGIDGLMAVAKAGGLAIIHNKNALLRESGYVYPGGVAELPLEDIAPEILKRMAAQPGV